MGGRRITHCVQRMTRSGVRIILTNPCPLQKTTLVLFFFIISKSTRVMRNKLLGLTEVKTILAKSISFKEDEIKIMTPRSLSFTRNSSGAMIMTPRENMYKSGYDSAAPVLKNIRMIAFLQVNYVRKAANVHESGYKLNGSAYVLSKYIDTWLWDRVRVSGGAYGGSC